MRTKTLFVTIILFSLLAACRLPTGRVSVDLTFPETPTSTPTCKPSVTANIFANVRSGPDTAYSVVGSLVQGQTATIVGRNDAYTWWYIDYPGVSDGHAWVSGTVVTSSCVPAEVQVVAASDSLAATAVTSGSPTATVVISDSPTATAVTPASPTATPDPIQKLNILRPDLVITSMQVSPNPAMQNSPVSVQIIVQNRGLAPSGDFSVQWLAANTTVGCSWVVSSLGVGGMANLSCSYTYKDWNNAYTIKAVADTGAQVVEVNEDNNSLTDTLEVKPAP